MAGRVAVECPGCLAKLNLSDSSKLGKKIKCPKCSDIFVAKASDEDDDVDDLDDEDEAPAKSKGGKRPAAGGKRGGGKKGGSSGKDANNTPIIIGAVVGVVALIGGGLFLSGVFNRPAPPAPAPVAPQMPQMAPPMAVAPPTPPAMSPTERMLALRWMPSGTEVLVHAKVSEVWKAPLLKQVLEMPDTAKAIAEMRKATGMEPVDIESVTYGLSDLKGTQGVAMAAAMGMPVQPTQMKYLAVVRTKKAMSLDQILSASQEIKPAEYKSKRYFESVKQEQPFGGWIVDSTTLVIGPPTELKDAIDRGETVMPRKELLFADATSHVLILVAPRDMKSMAGPPQQTPPGTPPELAAMQKALTDSFSGFALGVNIRGGVDVQSSLLLANAESTATVKTGADFLAKQGREQFDKMKETSPPLLAELGEILLTNLKIESQSQIVKVSTGVPDSEQEKLEQLPVVVAGMMMTGGLAGAMMGGGGMGPGAMTPGGVGARPNPFGQGRRPPRPGKGNAPPGPAAFNPQEMEAPMIAGVNPSASDPVDADSTDGLPEGATLTASSAWPLMPALTSDMKSTPTIQIMVDITGLSVGQICGYGPLTIKTLSLAGGGNLKVSKAVTVGQGNVMKTTIPFDPAEPNRMIHPEGTLRIMFHADPPSGQGKAIEAFEGTFKILTFEEFEEFTIDDAPKVAKRPLADPGLKTAGVKLRVLADAMSLSCGKDYFLGSAKVTDTANPGGPMMLSFVPETDKSQTIQKLQGFGGKLPDTLQVQFKVFRSPKEKTVTFKFANIPLPSPETKPQALPPGVGPGGPMPPN